MKELILVAICKRIPQLFIGLAVLLVLCPGLTKAAETLTVAPASANLTNNQSITLALAGTDAHSVQWTMSPAVGALAPFTGGAIFTVPANLTQSISVQIMATSSLNSAIIAQAVLLLVPTVSMAVTPASADLIAGGQQSLQAAVTGSANNAVSWSLSPQLGTISAGGIYTAPSAITSDTTVTVTATAQANTSVRQQIPIRLHANGIYFTTQANGLQSVVFNGTDYNYVYGEGLLSYVTMQKPDGTTAWITPGQCSGTFTGNSVTKTCYAGSDPIALSVQYSVPAFGTVEADIQLTNQSATDTIVNATISTLGVRMAQFDPANSSTSSVSEQNPLSYVSYVSGRFALWVNTPGPNVSVGLACGWTYLCKNQPVLLNIAPGQTIYASYSIRFSTNMTQNTVTWVPEAYSEYAKAYPSIVNWPDRRPIMAWFISDHSHQSASNPRGYLWDPAIDVTQPGFQTKVLSQAASLISQIKSRPVQPQGIVIWDLEGQEFIQATTYVGDPRIFSQGYAPEMNAAADQLFALFKNAGFKVGTTLRPQSLQWGPAANLPATCNSNAADHDYWDFYIAVDAPFQKSYYGCSQQNTWTQYPNGSGGQTFFQHNAVQQEISLLTAKVAYARARWGTTIYYVDTTVWSGGAPIQASIFRALQQAFPDSLFIPEESYVATMAVAMPYSEPKNTNSPKFAPVTWRYAYPTGALGIYLSNCVGSASCWAASAANFDIGQKIGDIPLYTVPTQMSAAQFNTIEGMILQARSEAGSVTVTDSSSGATYSYAGSPATVYQYPLKMRVYFAASATALKASQIYCESGGWLGENSCTLNLSGLTSAQVRYYDFTNKLVIVGAAQGR